MSNSSAQTRDEAAQLARNVAESLPRGALAGKLSEALGAQRPLRVKLGIDPTAPDIHLGHLVVLAKLREFQDLGHRVVLIIGDYTARVGDPSGRSATRPILDEEQIEANALTYQEQAFRILDPDPERVEVRRNAEWLDMPMRELLTLTRTTTVAQLLERDDFARRLAAGRPISMLETLYPLLQGFDSVAVRADVEVGGTDQTFNLLLARDIQRAYGQSEQAVLTMPLLVGTDGAQKMSKSLGNQIGVADAAEEMFGKTMSIPDRALADYHRLLLGTPVPGVAPRDAKRALARSLVGRLHGVAAAERAEAHFQRVVVQRQAPDEVPEHPYLAPEETVHVPALLAEAFGMSRSQGRRLIDQGGVTLGGAPLVAGEHDVSNERADGEVLQVGKRRYRRLRRR